MAKMQGPRQSMVFEGNTSGAAMRGAAALPGSKATSYTQGSRRNLGDLMPPETAKRGRGPRQEVEETKLSGKM